LCTSDFLKKIISSRCISGFVRIMEEVKIGEEIGHLFCVVIRGTSHCVVAIDELSLKRDLCPYAFLRENFEQKGMGDPTINDMDFHAAGIERFEA